MKLAARALGDSGQPFSVQTETHALPHQSALAVGLEWLSAEEDEDDVPTERFEMSEGTDRYRVGEEIGRGGMGVVLRARDVDLGRDVALKTALGGDDPQAAARLVLEAQVTAELDHPAVLPVYDLDTDTKGSPFFAMKLVHGHESLADVIARLKAGDPGAHRRYTFQRRVAIVQRVCHALDYAHQRGVLHRDIKPENVLVGPCGEVYLVDWGLATSTGRTGESDRRPVLREDPSVIRGTPLYMAPEQFQWRPADARSDVYALTALLYELLTLRHYLGAPETLEALTKAAIGEEPLAADAFSNPISGRVPRALARICARGLRKVPGDRYLSARALEQALQAWLEGFGPVFCPGTLLQRALACWVRGLDQFPFLGPLLSYIAIGLLLGALVAAFRYSL